MGTDFQFGKSEKGLEMDIGDVYTAMWMYFVNFMSKFYVKVKKNKRGDNSRWKTSKQFWKLESKYTKGNWFSETKLIKQSPNLILQLWKEKKKKRLISAKETQKSTGIGGTGSCEWRSKGCG